MGALHDTVFMAFCRWVKSKLTSRDSLSPMRIKEIHLDGLPTIFLRLHNDLDHDRIISQMILDDGVWEPYETAIFRSCCAPGDFVLDLGANLGWYSIIASHQVGPKGKILCFEPNPDTYELLQWNMSRSPYKNSILRKEAVGRKTEKAFLYLSESNSGDHRIIPDRVSRKNISIAMTSLDDVFSRQNEFPAIVKCDTQGAEFDILHGACGLFNSGWRPLMFLEYWPYVLRMAGYDPYDLWAMLYALDYELFEIVAKERKIIPLTKEYIEQKLATNFDDEDNFLDIIAVYKDDKQGKKEKIYSFVDASA